MAGWWDKDIASLRAAYPQYDFWYVNTLTRCGLWCWKPKDQPYGTASRNRATVAEVRAAIDGGKEEIRVFGVSAQTRNGDSGGERDPGDRYRDQHLHGTAVAKLGV